MLPELNIEQLIKECRFQATPSSGPGGQHVNKVNTRVEVRFNIPQSQLLSDQEKEILLQQLSKKINADGEIIVVSQEERSQLQNKNKSFEKLIRLLTEALTPEKERRPTFPKPVEIQKRLDEKAKLSVKKKFRKPPIIE